MIKMVDTYIAFNKYTSVKWQVFQSHVNIYIDLNLPNMGIKEKIDWETWIYGPGLAPIHQDFTTKSLNDSLALVDAYMNNDTATFDHAKATKLWTSEFRSTTKTIFAQNLNL